MYRNRRTSSFLKISTKPHQRSVTVVRSHRLLREIQRRYTGRSPNLLGHPIRLTELFIAVVSRGGYKKVCEHRLWNDVASDLYVPAGCANVSIGLRRIYHQFLTYFEFREFPVLSDDLFSSGLSDADGLCEELQYSTTMVERHLGISPSVSDVSNIVGDNGERSSRSSRIFSCHSQEYQGYMFGDKLHVDNSTLQLDLTSDSNAYIDMHETSELRLAELSLSSGLPNEVEIALNSIILLSITSSGSSTGIRLAHCTNLLPVLLATVGIYGDGCGSYMVCDDVWRKQNHLQFAEFWHFIVREPSGRIFIRPDVFINSELTEDELDPTDVDTTRDLFASVNSQNDHTNQVVDSLELSRVFQIATILINLVTAPPLVNGEDEDIDFGLSLDPDSLPITPWNENARVIAASPSALRFIFLCAYAEHSGVRSLGLQLLSSLRYPLDPPECPLTLECPFEWTPLLANGCHLGHLTLTFLTHCILGSCDRSALIAGLNLLTNLAKVPYKSNAQTLLYGLSDSLWPRLAHLICLPDLAIVCATLEALRCLTNLGTPFSLMCWQSCLSDDDHVPLMLTQPLLSLLTLEGQAMGSQSLHRIRLMQRNPPITVQSHHPRASNNQWELHRHRDSLTQYNRHIKPRPSPGHPTRNDRHRSFVDNYSPPGQIQSQNVRLPVPVTVLDINDEVVFPSCDVPPTTLPVRSPNGITSCTGLINLLSSSPSLPDTSSTSVLTCHTHLSSKPSTSPSLAELTDRLQMPPPSLPPPSALRRTAKLLQSKVLSPPQSTLSGTKISLHASPSSPCSPLAAVWGKVDTMDHTPSSLPLCTSSVDIKQGPPSSVSMKSINVPKSLSIPDAITTTSVDADSKSEANSYLNLPSTTILESKDHHIEPMDLVHPIITTTCFSKSLSNPLTEKSSPVGQSPLHNGCQEDASHNISAQKYNLSQPIAHTNGLKPSLLQAAVSVIHDKELKQLNSLVVENSMKQSEFTTARTNGLKVYPDNNEFTTTHEDVNNSDDVEQKKLDIVDQSCILRKETCNHDELNGNTINGHVTDSDVNLQRKPSNRIDNDSEIIPLSRVHRSRLHKSSLFNYRLSLKRRRLSFSTFRKNTSISLTTRRNNIIPRTHPPTNSAKSSCATETRNVSPPCNEIGDRSPASLSAAVAHPTKMEYVNTAASSVTEPQHPTLPEPQQIMYFCEWECCSTAFPCKQEVASHVYGSHLNHKDRHKCDTPFHSTIGPKFPQQYVRRCCRWRGCQTASVARAPFALVMHVLDIHCSSRELEARRLVHQHQQQKSPNLGMDPSTIDSADANYLPSLGSVDHDYLSVGDQSAWSVIRSVESKNFQSELWTAHYHYLASNPHVLSNMSVLNSLPPPPPPNLHTPPREGPVTKHLRVTAALILRNLITHVDKARTWMVSQSNLLSEIVVGCSPNEHGLRTNDAGRIIAQCLALCTYNENVNIPSFIPDRPSLIRPHSKTGKHSAL